MLKNRSIRFKITILFAAVLIVIVGLTFFAVRFAGQTVLRGTIRNYLIGTVEENAGMIQFTSEQRDGGSIYMPYAGGYLEIDEDFMQIVNDVHAALYSADGEMIYGEDPLARMRAEVPGFSQTHTWHMELGGIRYDIYDRRLNIELPDGDVLWIRGVVPETRSAAQIAEITRLSLILLPALILLAAALGYLLADRMLSPIRKIESAAVRISGGDDLAERIEEEKNNDEIGRLARVFNGMLARLERAFDTERQFTSDASHELRTPTAVILAQCDYTLERERTPQEYENALRVVQRQGRRMSVLIGDMLEYTRMDQNAERYKLEPTDISQLVQETAEAMELIGERDISLSTRVQSGLTLQGNRALLTRLTQNLIGNAYRYGRENGHIEVVLEQREEGGVRLTVADDGPGIAPEEQEKIFDRFYRSDSARSEQGTGLGLSMVKKIAELHGASVSLDSTLGEGSAFHIDFPQQ
ncbi:MAG: HAMP domain-containing protein [Clostridia bacterium]|nr:HAMP domain-containing protein [Clostridia bacterium]